MKLKLLTWNTLFGGFDGTDARRYQLLLEVIRDVRPDVLLLQELKGYEANGAKLLYQTEQALGLRGLLGLAPHTGQNTAIFFRPDIQPLSFEVDAVHFHHAASIAQLKLPDVVESVSFASVHLCPNSPRVRWREASYLVNLADPAKLALVAGDFNSVSPHDPEPEGWENLSPHFRSRYLLPGSATADRETLATIYHHGFIDVAHKLGPTGEATVPGASFPKSEFVFFRCDHVVATPRLADKAVSYRVIKDPRTDAASDHYPVLVEFEL
jgi:endonuclease/exonuclease/phosphatase family metal-dependent hydrolase